MINFRYHIVSLTAVFLALLIGILMGTTVVSKATVDGLKSNVQRAEARSAAVHETNNRLEDELSARTDTAEAADKALDETALVHTVNGQLEDAAVLVIETEGVDKDLTANALETLAFAGVDTIGTLRISDQLADDGDQSDRLRESLGLSEGTNPQRAAARDLAEVLTAPVAEEPETTTTTPADPPEGPDQAPTTTTTLPAEIEPDVLDVLIDEGFVTFRPKDGTETPPTIRDILGTVDHRYVVITGPEPAPVDDAFVLPLVAEMARRGPAPQVFATGPANWSDPDAADELIAKLLDRKGVQGRVSTVDDLGTYTGHVALVYALAEAGEARFGSYGIGPSATAVLPEIAAPDTARSDEDP